jgi:hypothetical protein
MSLINRIRWTRKSRTPSNRIRAAIPRTKLLLAALEDRTVPATITVTGLGDSVGVDGTVTLREAIQSLNAGADVNSDVAGKSGTYGVNDSIIFSVSPGTLTMSGGEFAIMKSMSITGPGASSLTIDAGSLSRHFNISDDTASQITVSMSGMTLINGQAPDPDFSMGITGNGGSIFIRNEIVSLDSMVISGNKTSNVVGVGRPSGGAISLGDAPVPTNSSGLGGTLNVNNCEIDNNYSANVGGGIGTQFPNNLAGGVGNVFTITNSTVANNIAANRGGGIYFSGNAGGQLGSSFSMRNTTVSGNRSQFAFGGGVQINSTTTLPMSILNSTITNNTASTTPGGGGLVLNTGTGTLNIESSIIAGNTGPASAPDIFTTSGGQINSKNNIIGSKTGINGNTYFANQGGTIISSAKLGPLTNNGGLTLTHMPSYNSLAINPGAVTATTLSVAMTATDVTATVVSNTNIASGTYILIDSEVMLVTGTTGGTGLTVTRAQLGTSAAAHTLGKAVNNGFFAVTTLSTAATSGASTITVTSASNLTVGSFIAIDSELQQITAISSSTVTLGATLASNHAIGAGVTSAAPVQTTLGPALTSGATSAFVINTTGIAPGNRLQIDSEIVKVTQVAPAAATTLSAAIGSTTATFATVASTANLAIGMNLNIDSENVKVSSIPAVTTALTAAITNVATSCSVNSATGIAVNQLLLIDSEYVQVTAIAGTTLTIARGASGTTAAAHSLGATVSNTSLTVATQLSAAITNVATTCVVANATGIVNTQLLLIDAEYVQVTGISGNTLTITRGQNGTTAAAHSSGAAVLLPLNSAALNATATICTVTSTSNISVGMLMLIDSEYVLVTGVTAASSTSPGILTIARGQNGTTAASHLNRVPLTTSTIGISRAQLGTTAASHGSGVSVLAPSLTIVRGQDSTSAAAHVSGRPLLIPYDQRGVARRQGSTIDIGAVEVNPATPAAIAAASNVTVTGGTTGTFTVTYTSTLPNTIDLTTVDSNNSAVRVTGPGGFNVPATWVSDDNNTASSLHVVTYSFAAPGGMWDYTENGAYSIVMQNNQVKDSAANPVPAAVIGGSVIGQFTAAIGRSLIVTSAADSGAGTLRDAISLANSNAFVVDSITFDTVTMGSSLITVSTELLISDPVVITGPGITVDGGGTTRVFHTAGIGNMAVSMSGLTIQRNCAEH